MFLVTKVVVHIWFFKFYFFRGYRVPPDGYHQRHYQNQRNYQNNSPNFMSMTLSVTEAIVWHFVSLQVWHFTSCKILYDTLHHYASMTQYVWHKKYDRCFQSDRYFWKKVCFIIWCKNYILKQNKLWHSKIKKNSYRAVLFKWEVRFCISQTAGWISKCFQHQIAFNIWEGFCYYHLVEFHNL